jgi:sugar O-acyltransferase (sialic acid O-acetyltransferase NeuD family)
MKKALIGFGGHAREVMSQMGKKIPCFVDDQYVKHEDETIPLSLFNPDEYEIMIAISDPYKRYEVSKKLHSKTKYFTFIHPTALIMDKNINIGKGSFVGAYSILTTNISIGNHCILNRGNHVGHDSVVGDFFSSMPCSVVSGNCTIGDRVYLGTNSSIREKIEICDDVTIGLNSGVVKHIKESGVYVGLPSKKIK